MTRLKKDEEVVLFPALGWRDPSGAGWLLDLHGWVYEPEPRRASLAVLQRLVGLRLEDLTVEEKKYFKERTRWFLVDNERGKRLHVTIGGRVHELGRTEANGHVRKLIAVLEGPAREAGWKPGTEPMTLNVPADDDRKVRGTVHLVGEEGWTVISDIDDTIRVTEVRSRKALVRNTFCREFQPTGGMADVYTGWAEAGAVFHYVSASPWQLYPDLERFRAKEGYPQGTFHLRHFRFKDRSGLKFLLQSGKFKSGEIAGLLERFPRRKFVLVGDSGEKDPEIYGELARRHPGQVMRVLIRSVTDEPPDGERYRTAFQGLAEDGWAVFKHGDEVRDLGPKCVGTGGQ